MKWASGGTLQLDSPAFEGKDVSAIITDVLSLPETANNKRIGMVGGSYGGGIQLVSAAIDPRIDAIVPGIAWNTLNASLYPNNAFKTSWAAMLTLDLLEAGARINPQIYSGVITGALLGILTRSQQSLLAYSGPGALVGDITVPRCCCRAPSTTCSPCRRRSPTNSCWPPTTFPSRWSGSAAATASAWTRRPRRSGHAADTGHAGLAGPVRQAGRHARPTPSPRSNG